ncbi:uncharacterized protein LOC116778148 isoform X2 [Danaus plexippus]|uniref:uncharacterized protein LOC116778148 isoform X2 n=1 Tax=Danaus plexippus TaxID=13037 RepID=UPI002AAF9C0B|nr:uncharacterized protein LOC116778148 isoform X2 [Danaus plexippus]
MNQHHLNSGSEFTRGEKCIFTHLVLTFCLIFVSVMIYLIHLYLVSHTINTVFNTRRRASTYPQFDAVPIGVIYLNSTPVRRICNTLLLKSHWSLGPGHCVALMSHPDLSHLLLDWRLKYRYNNDVKIKRTVVHPHFDTGTYENNIGVIRHNDLSSLQTYNCYYNMALYTTDVTKFAVFIIAYHNMLFSYMHRTLIRKLRVPNINYEKLYGDVNNKGNLMIVTWQPGAPLFEDWSNTVGAFPVQLMSQKDCKIEMAPIVDVRSYEMCAVFEKAIYTSVEHGSLAIQMDSFEVVGLVTWGEKLYRTYPLVILNVSYFKEWLDVAITT